MDPNPWFAKQCGISNEEAYQWRIALSTGATPGPRPNTVLTAMKWLIGHGTAREYVLAVRDAYVPHLDYDSIELLHREGVPPEYVVAADGFGAPGAIRLFKAGVPQTYIERETRPSHLSTVIEQFHEAGVPAEYARALQGQLYQETIRMWQEGIALEYALQVAAEG